MGQRPAFDEFIGFSGVAHYPFIYREVPPDDDLLVKDGGWWGCPYWLVRDGSPPERAVTADLSKVFSSLDAAPEGKSAEIRPARFAGNTDGKRSAVLLVGAAPGFGVDPRFLLYAEATAEVDDWFYVSGVGEKEHWLEGRRNKIRVALVPPIRLTETPWVDLPESKQGVDRG